nr:30S ribosomal protein S14 [Picochlorum sp. 'soloecismus']
MTRSRRAVTSRDHARRYLYAQYESQRNVLLGRIHDLHLSPASRGVARHIVQEIPRASASCRIVRRCVVSGRGGGVLRRYRLSRLVFRRLARQGFIPGIVKASW